jgi:hypothetical protein
MKWFIQDSTSFGSLDRNVKPLIAALDELQVRWIPIGLVPFSWEITGIDPNESKDNAIFYGSTKLVEKVAAEKEYTPGVFYEENWFEQAEWIKHHPSMLNSDSKLLTIKELKENWPIEVSFIRPRAVKSFVGQVIEPDEKDSWSEENSELPDDCELYLSPTHNIEREWRFFIVDGKIVTGSLYKWCRILRTKEEIPKDIWENAQKLADIWLPSPNIVMDVCQLRNYTLKIVEWNCISCSGGYNSDWKKLIEALNGIR